MVRIYAFIMSSNIKCNFRKFWDIVSMYFYCYSVWSINPIGRIPRRAVRAYRGFDYGKSAWPPFSWEGGKGGKLMENTELRIPVMVHHTGTKCKSMCNYESYCKTSIKLKSGEKGFQTTERPSHWSTRSMSRCARIAVGRILPTNL